jgi:predicted nucleic acid-binding protein
VRRSERKYALDTNLFIDAFRDDESASQLEAFHAAFAPFEYLSAVVAQELRAGVTGVAAARLEQHVLRPFERRGRLITPGYFAWKQTGAVLAALGERDGLAPRSVTRAFVNDVLLAVSCRDAGVTLVTQNQRDFQRIARVAPFDYVAGWPTPIA